MEQDTFEPETRELTYGEKMVGLTFNPSQDDNVRELKEKSAKFIDHCNELRGITDDGEQKALFTLAIRKEQEAQMWAVKAATWLMK